MLPSALRTLSECEQVIDAGWSTFIDVGLALKEVRERELWRSAPRSAGGECRSFTEYLLERDWSRAESYRLIEHAETAAMLAALSPNGDKPNHPEARTLSLVRRKEGDEKAAQMWTARLNGTPLPRGMTAYPKEPKLRVPKRLGAKQGQRIPYLTSATEEERRILRDNWHEQRMVLMQRTSRMPAVETARSLPLEQAKHDYAVLITVLHQLVSFASELAARMEIEDEWRKERDQMLGVREAG